MLKNEVPQGITSGRGSFLGESYFSRKNRLFERVKVLAYMIDLKNLRNEDASTMLFIIICVLRVNDRVFSNDVK
jgi:hypothetical protein